MGRCGRSEPAPLPGRRPRTASQACRHGDLLVVRQHVIGYAAGEVAYVEKSRRARRWSGRTRRAETVERRQSRRVRRVATTARRSDDRSFDSVANRTRSSTPIRRASRAAPVPRPTASWSRRAVQEQAQRAAETFGRDVSARAVGRVTDRLRVETRHRRCRSSPRRSAHLRQQHRHTARDRRLPVARSGRSGAGLLVRETGVLRSRPAGARRACSCARWPSGRCLAGPPVKPAPFTLESTRSTTSTTPITPPAMALTGVEPPPEPADRRREPFARARRRIFSDKPEVSIQEAVPDKVPIPPGYRAVTARITRRWRASAPNPRYFNITVGSHHRSGDHRPAHVPSTARSAACR